MHGTLQWVSFFSSSANKKQKKQKQTLIGQHTNSGSKKERTLTFKKGLSDANTSFLFRRRSASFFAPCVTFVTKSSFFSTSSFTISIVTAAGIPFPVFLGFFLIVSFAVAFDMVFAVFFFVFFLTRLRGAARDEDDVGSGGGVATDAVLFSPLQRKHSN
jgi:hypothetical protein